MKKTMSFCVFRNEWYIKLPYSYANYREWKI